MNRQQTKPPIYESVSDNLLLQMFFGFCFGNIKVLPLRLLRDSIQIRKNKHLFFVDNVAPVSNNPLEWLKFSHLMDVVDVVYRLTQINKLFTFGV